MNITNVKVIETENGRTAIEVQVAGLGIVTRITIDKGKYTGYDFSGNMLWMVNGIYNLKTVVKEDIANQLGNLSVSYQFVGDRGWLPLETDSYLPTEIDLAYGGKSNMMLSALVAKILQDFRADCAITITDSYDGYYSAQDVVELIIPVLHMESAAFDVYKDDGGHTVLLCIY